MKIFFKSKIKTAKNEKNGKSLQNLRVRLAHFDLPSACFGVTTLNADCELLSGDINILVPFSAAFTWIFRFVKPSAFTFKLKSNGNCDAFIVDTSIVLFFSSNRFFESIRWFNSLVQCFFFAIKFFNVSFFHKIWIFKFFLVIYCLIKKYCLLFFFNKTLNHQLSEKKISQNSNKFITRVRIIHQHISKLSERKK